MPTQAAVKYGKLDNMENINHITIGETEPHTQTQLLQAHKHYTQVFNNDLTGGYNGYYGEHVCKLNWAFEQRPEAEKMKIANYNHDLKKLI